MIRWIVSFLPPQPSPVAPMTLFEAAKQAVAGVSLDVFAPPATFSTSDSFLLQSVFHPKIGNSFFKCHPATHAVMFTVFHRLGATVDASSAVKTVRHASILLGFVFGISQILQCISSKGGFSNSIENYRRGVSFCILELLKRHTWVDIFDMDPIVSNKHNLLYVSTATIDELSLLQDCMQSINETPSPPFTPCVGPASSAVAPEEPSGLKFIPTQKVFINRQIVNTMVGSAAYLMSMYNYALYHGCPGCREQYVSPAKEKESTTVGLWNSTVFQMAHSMRDVLKRM